MLNRRPVWIIGAVVILASLSIAGCGDNGKEAAGDTSPTAEAAAIPSPAYDWSDEPWNIVVSLPIFADFAREMGGGQVSVTSLIPPGINPHTYVPPPEAAELVQNADLAFVNGLGLDQPTIDFIEANQTSARLPIIEFARNVTSPTALQPAGGKPVFADEAGDNPHLYMDPVLARTYAEAISHSLVILDEINEPHYDALFARYKQQLQGLNDEIAADMTEIAAENRKLVTEHNSMIHWANRFGLTISGTLEDDGEDGVREILASQKPPAVFSEVGLGDGTLGNLASEAGVTACTLATDSIETGDESYIQIMKANAAEIVNCLGG